MSHSSEYEWDKDSHDTNGSTRADPVSPTELSELESAFRSRHTSISFADHVKLDSGGEVAMTEALPKSESRSGARGRSILQEMAEMEQARQRRTHSESERDRYDSLTGQPLDRRREERLLYHEGEGRHPLLQTTVDELARSAIVPSEAVSSPLPEGGRTPLDAEYLHSPVQQSPIPPLSSPIGFTSSQLPFGTRSDSQRSRSYISLSQHGSLRRSARRQSTRSFNSSKSPAGQFLSMLSAADSATTAPSAPDDEGQEIDQSGYIIGAQVGMGGFSVVKEVFSLENGKRVRHAVKIVRKQVKGKDDFENDRLQSEFEREVSIWRFLKHRYVLPLLAVYDSPFATFCITRFNVGGTLFDLVHSRRSKHLEGLPAALAKRYVYQVSSAIQYLHEEVRVLHRDIKLENILLDMSAPGAEETGGNVLLCDFGMADYIYNESRISPEPEIDHDGHGNIGPSQTSTSVTGSLRYAAPELFTTDGHQVYSTAADIWALGNVIYALLTNRLAFDDPFEPRVVVSIMAAEWDEQPLLDSPAVKDGSADAIALVKGCLTKSPKKRLSISGVMDSPWLRGCSELYDITKCEWVEDH